MKKDQLSLLCVQLKNLIVILEEWHHHHENHQKQESILKIVIMSAVDCLK